MVPGLVDRKSFYIGENKPNWGQKIKKWSVIGLVWPYSMWIESQISRYNISFMKVLTMGDKMKK